MSNALSLRIKSRNCVLTASPNTESVIKSLRGDLTLLGRRWVRNLGLNTEMLSLVEYEFVLQSTLDYIEALESILQRLQSDPSTSKELLGEIEQVLK